MRETVSVEEEFSRHPELKRHEVQELTEWIRQHPQFPTPSDLQVIRFLFSCYCDLEKAKNCIKVFYDIKLENPDFFFGRDILREELQEQINVVQFGLLPKKNPNGYVILCHRLQVFDPPRYVFAHSCRLLSMLAEAVLRRDGNPDGVVMLFDMRGVSFMHLFRLKISTLKLFFHYIQDALPVRVKEIHVFNTQPIANQIMFLIKPFLNKELLSCLHFHSSNYEEVQKYLPKDCLPSDFGGSQPSFAELHEEFKKWMLELRECFVEEDNEITEFIARRDGNLKNQSSSKFKTEFD